MTADSEHRTEPDFCLDTNSTFTGHVEAHSLRLPDDESALTIYEVTFDAGARTSWHTHPLGQALYVTAGRARVQIGNAPAQDYEFGSYIWIPAQTRHWHGATPDEPMTHVAVQQAAQDGTTVQWCEPVPNQTYMTLTCRKEHR